MIKRFNEFKINENNNSSVILDDKLKKIVNLIELNSEFTTEYSDKSDKVSFVDKKEDNFDTTEPTVGDVDGARRIVKLIRNNFNGVKIDLKVVDEFVTVIVELKK